MPDQVEVIPAPSPPVRVGRLDRERDVRVEMARLYRAARKGDIPVSDAAKLGFLLTQLARLIELSEIEIAVQELEEKSAQT